MKTTAPEKTYKIHMGPARFTADLCDGSERGEYVNQDYILHTLGKPQRAINLMYCYYPNEEMWPKRASEAYAGKNVSFAWDYPYDDYFPYTGGLGGDMNGEVFKQMRDIRRHGMDVILTLTMDPKVSDDQIRAIGRDLRHFGRIEVRLNHECTGDWFSFTKRASYAELGQFFVHAANLIREEAPNVKMIICAGAVEDLEKGTVEKEDEFKDAVVAADVWSMDKYLSLHWGWPYDIAEVGGKSFARYSVADVYKKGKATFNRYKELNGGEAKPFVLAELNADADVTGPYDQVEMIKEYVELLRADKDTWLTGFTFYQFRDRGRLGLEVEDPNDKTVGIRQPMMDYYINLINSPDFLPKMTELEKISVNGTELKNPETLRFGGARDCEGIAMEFKLSGNPVFFELYFDENEALVNSNFMIEANGQWFHKAPGTKCIDLMEAFFKKPLKGSETVTVRLFTPPASGENKVGDGDDLLNSYTTVKHLPKVRIGEKPIVEKVFDPHA